MEKIMWGLVINGVTSLFGNYTKARIRKEELKDVQHERRIEVIQQGNAAEASWNLKALENSGWKDEWLTILFSIPMILAFFPGAVPHVMAGFVALESMPIWYQSAVALMVASAFGYQKFINNNMMNAYTLPKD